MNIFEGLCFDDVLMVPKYSGLKSRSEVDLSVKLNKRFEFKLPFTPSNMKTISELSMIRLMYENKGLGNFHRFCDFDTQLKWLEEVKSWGKDATKYVSFSVGVKSEDKEKVDRLVENGCEIIIIDIAHGYSEHCIEMTNYISNKHKHVLLISGNVANGEGARALWKAGADVVKANVGSGSVCLTKINTGNGVPSISTLDSCHNARLSLEKELGKKLYLMQDGGCKNPGDVAKSLAFADLTMLGNIFAGTDQAAGEIVQRDGIKYKSYVGSSTHRGVHKEGVEALKEYKGSAQDIIQQISEGLQSACSYQGVRNLNDFKLDPVFVKISNAGLTESGPHSLHKILR